MAPNHHRISPLPCVYCICGEFMPTHSSPIDKYPWPGSFVNLHSKKKRPVCLQPNGVVHQQPSNIGVSLSFTASCATGESWGIRFRPFLHGTPFQPWLHSRMGLHALHYQRLVFLGGGRFISLSFSNIPCLLINRPKVQAHHRRRDQPCQFVNRDLQIDDVKEAVCQHSSVLTSTGRTFVRPDLQWTAGPCQPVRPPNARSPPHPSFVIYPHHLMA